VIYAVEMAAFCTLADGWLIAHPDDPEMRRWLVEDEGCDKAFADAVLARMRKLGAARGLL
jgi:hypothetical protein